MRASRPLWGKHPAALGGLYRDVFQEAWDLVSADLKACFLWGETAVRDNMFIPILLNGIVEDHYWNYSLIPVYENGRIAGIYDAYRNTTEIVVGARKLRESEARLKIATEVAELGIFVWHIVEDIATWENERMYQIFGLTRDDDPIRWLRFMNEVVHPDFVEAFQQSVEASIRTREMFHFEGMICSKDETSSWIEITGQLKFDADRLPVRMFGTVRDVTRIKKSEAALRTAEKLSVVARLAASIAHEINNPLEAVTNLLYLARHSGLQAEVVQRYLDIAERELRRVSVISNQTLRFYRQSTHPTAAKSEELFEGVLSIHKGRFVNSGIEVQKGNWATRPVTCFEGEIQQVLNNLMGNAIDAMNPAGGRLLVRSREATDWKTGRKGLTLTIADTGAGMSPQVLKKIFEPFFTTRGIDRSGLGLWLSKDITKRHQGVLRVRSRQREGMSGTVFALFLPFGAVTPMTEPYRPCQITSAETVTAS